MTATCSSNLPWTDGRWRTLRGGFEVRRPPQAPYRGATRTAMARQSYVAQRRSEVDGFPRSRRGPAVALSLARSVRPYPDRLVASRPVRCRRRPLLGLDFAEPVGGPHLDRVLARCRVPAASPLDPGGLARSRPTASPATTPRRRSGPRPSRFPDRAPRRRPAIATGPAATAAPSRGTSIRDWVRIGASLAQPRGIQ